MLWRGRRLPKHNHGGRHQGVSELHVSRTKAVYVKQRYLFSEIAAKGGAVIYIHEFCGNEPNGESLLFHPVVAQQKEVAIQTGKTTDLNMQGLRKPGLEPAFLSCG